MASGKDYSHFTYVTGVSVNTLTTSGLFFCDSCTDFPSGTPWTSFVIEVSSIGTVIKQVAKPVYTDSGFCFERRYTSGSWEAWSETGRALHLQGNTVTTQYIRKPGNAQYGSFIITGTAAGLGAVVIAVTINSGAISVTRNLMTGTAWTDSGLTITYGVTNSVGYIGIKTTSSLGSNLCIIGG